MRESLKSAANRHQLPVTNSVPGPGDFPLGSPESRAAARVLLTARSDEQNRVQQTVTVICEVVGGTDKPPRCERRLGENGVLTEFVYHPDPVWTPEQLRSFIEKHPVSRERSG